jgi:glycosyltransferase involved in cell wall biosynthesis
MKISLIHPSRGRANRAFDTYLNWTSKLGNAEIEYILSIDTTDKEEYLYKLNFTDANVNIIVNDNSNAVQAINAGASRSTGDILIVVSDDFDCPNKWDQLIWEATNGKKDWILKTDDGIQKWIITIPIMDREYYNRFNYMYYPGYEHMFCDTEITCVADLIGRKLEANITFPHLHYTTGKSKKDYVSEKADKTWERGEKLFLERYKNRFQLKDIAGKITSEEYLNWINKKLK